ncbi:unnamed protein product [Macrosiphum euphorbiae]|uniref:Uncharacterized protein n=1 Tax=Macrosiphum euphorbiae TaxID=13131 RepID=A0AAV0VLX0_9HEMI|nr:unnamed protein product [Macrosiphum euphorbiae]
MAHPWPTEPHEKQLLLHRLRDKYSRLFGPEHLEADMVEILKPEQNNTSIAVRKYHVQKIEINSKPEKTAQQLKIEAQYERKRSALRTRYKLEPTFTMPDTITAVPVVKDPHEQEEVAADTTENTTASEEIPIDQPEGSEIDLEIMINLEEKQDIEGIEDIPPIAPVISNRERKRLLWLSKIPKKH